MPIGGEEEDEDEDEEDEEEEEREWLGITRGVRTRASHRPN